MARTIADGYVELRLDDSKLDAQTKNKAERIAKDFGGKLNSTLSALSLNEIDLKADPRNAIRAMDEAEKRLKAISRNAETIEIKVKADTALGELGRLRKRLGEVGDEGAQEFTTKFVSVFGRSIPAPFAAALGGVAVAAAPVIGAAVAGAVIGGAGIGGVIGGITIASKDQRVQAAAAAVKAHIGEQLQDAALPFVSATQDGLATLESGFNEVGGNIESIMRNASRFVQPLAEGLVGFAQPVIEGLDEIIAKAAPVIEAIRQGLSEVGQAVGDVFHSLADNGREGAVALAILFNTIKAGIQIVGAVINGLTEAFGFFIDLADKAGFLSDDMKKKIDSFRAAEANAGAAGQASTGGITSFLKAVDDSGEAAAAAGPKYADLATQLQEVAAANISAAEAVIRQREATISAGKAADKHRGVSNAEQSALLSLASAMNTNTKAADEQGRTVRQATTAHEANRKKLIEVAVKMGYTRDQAIQLANKYLAIPKNVNTAIATPGLTQSDRKIKDYDKMLDALARQITSKVNVVGDDRVRAKLTRLLIQQQALAKGISISAAASAFSKQEGHAQGGPITGPGTKTSDSVLIRASRGEYMHQASAVDYYGVQAMDAINARRIPRDQLAGYATGGLVAPFPVNAAITKIMSLQEALSKVTPAGGPSLRFMIGAVKAAFPFMQLISGYRPGARTLSGSISYHALRRATDWPASYPLAEWISYKYGRRSREVISPWNELNWLNGRHHAYSGAVYRQHSGRNAHVHWAMDNGGYLMPGWNPPIYNGTGRPEPVTPGSDMDAVKGLLAQLIAAVHAVAPGVGAHINRGLRGVDAAVGATADLYARGAW